MDYFTARDYSIVSKQIAFYLTLVVSNFLFQNLNTKSQLSAFFRLCFVNSNYLIFVFLSTRYSLSNPFLPLFCLFLIDGTIFFASSMASFMFFHISSLSRLFISVSCFLNPPPRLLCHDFYVIPVTIILQFILSRK